MLFAVIHVVVVLDFVTIHVQHDGLGFVVREDLHLLAVRAHFTVDPLEDPNLQR